MFCNFDDKKNILATAADTKSQNNINTSRTRCNGCLSHLERQRRWGRRWRGRRRQIATANIEQRYPGLFTFCFCLHLFLSVSPHEKIIETTEADTHRTSVGRPNRQWVLASGAPERPEDRSATKQRRRDGEAVLTLADRQRSSDQEIFNFLYVIFSK